MPTTPTPIPEELHNIKCSVPMTEDVCQDIIRYREFIKRRKQAQAAQPPQPEEK